MVSMVKSTMALQGNVGVTTSGVKVSISSVKVSISNMGPVIFMSYSMKTEVSDGCRVDLSQSLPSSIRFSCLSDG